jgi:ubiquinone/menaquinone biosynthesis C-methylase UbiE
MEKNKQKEAFLSYEADAWFDRNKEYLLKYNVENDEVVKLIKSYNIKPENILEIGCSAGHRLNGIKSIFPKCQVYGVEPSQKAIAFGKSNYKNIHLFNGTADNLNEIQDESMDLVIVGFMLYVIDRTILLKVISEINRVLKDGGALILVDFFAEVPQKKDYSHIKNFSAFSFKQNYDEIFTSSKLYFLIDKSTFNHSTAKLDASNDYYNNYSIALLKKDIDAGYK